MELIVTLILRWYFIELFLKMMWSPRWSPPRHRT